MLQTALRIDIQKTSKSRLSELDQKNLQFGKYFSDHMFVADYANGEWTSAQILPYGKMELSPSTSAFHYGQAIFEGMKAYRSESGDSISLFRPEANWRRMNISAERMAMPIVPEELFMDGLSRLISLDKNWVPADAGTSLYIRPFMISTDEYIGVKPSDSYKFIIITSPVAAYYNAPVRVLVETNYIRAVEGGIGFVKAAGNYGRSLFPTRLAQQRGYQQIIWTDARNHRFLEESGTMNAMFMIDDILITPPLGDTILAGITRDSVLTLARDWGYRVQERKISIDEIVDAHKKKTLQEAFGTGTAATIAHMSAIGFEGKDYELPPVAERIFSNRVAIELEGIKKGKLEDKHNWLYSIK
ncbi:MAG TPA: branched-chain amino acid aminotransferase [Bacteroidia bacterium]|jgi:branched-chain amino acid aminotransferase|nr:branched-chain amino acid aminotransferase [Bacteroidia bacterium]